jgi:hypothetical protein
VGGLLTCDAHSGVFLPAVLSLPWRGFPSAGLIFGSTIALLSLLFMCGVSALGTHDVVKGWCCSSLDLTSCVSAIGVNMTLTHLQREKEAKLGVSRMRARLQRMHVVRAQVMRIVVRVDADVHSFCVCVTTLCLHHSSWVKCVFSFSFFSFFFFFFFVSSTHTGC